jgi:hypothetical protein
MNEPDRKYKHDCQACLFLGSYEECDLYFCNQAGCGVSTVIARFGNGGHEYMSGLNVARNVRFPRPMQESEASSTKAIPHDDVPEVLRALRVAYVIAKDIGLVDVSSVIDR